MLLVQEDQPDDAVRFVRLEALGISATDYVITCESMPRTVLLPSSVDEVLVSSDPVALADSVTPPAGHEHSRAFLGKYYELKVSVICVGMTPACCLSRTRRICCK